MKIVRFYFQHSGDWWIGRAVELHIASQARTLPGICNELLHMTIDHFDTCAEHNIDPCRVDADVLIGRVSEFNSTPYSMRAEMCVSGGSAVWMADAIVPDKVLANMKVVP